MSISVKFKIGDKVLCTQTDYESWYGFKDILTINSEPFLDLNGKDICYWVKEKPNNDLGILEDHFIRHIEIIPKLEQQYSDGDVCLYGERQVVIIGEPNKEEQSAQVVDYPFAEDWQFQVETRPLGHLGMVLWNRFEEETKAPCNGLTGTEKAVHSPQHYDLFDGTEAIEVIASALTQAEFRGYCFGNLLKYRLRAGKKDDVVQELMKADKYKELYENYKHLCKEG